MEALPRENDKGENEGDGVDGDGRDGELPLADEKPQDAEDEAQEAHDPADHTLECQGIPIETRSRQREFSVRQRPVKQRTLRQSSGGDAEGAGDREDPATQAVDFNLVDGPAFLKLNLTKLKILRDDDASFEAASADHDGHARQEGGVGGRELASEGEGRPARRIIVEDRDAIGLGAEDEGGVIPRGGDDGDGVFEACEDLYR